METADWRGKESEGFYEERGLKKKAVPSPDATGPPENIDHRQWVVSSHSASFLKMINGFRLGLN